MKFKVTQGEPEALVKRAFFLAWQACGGPLGMGIFQDRGEQDEEAVWQNVLTAGDYAMQVGHRGVYGDYVFGRMMKLGFREENGVYFANPDVARLDYQSWAVAYPHVAILINEAATQVGCIIERIDI